MEDRLAAKYKLNPCVTFHSFRNFSEETSAKALGELNLKDKVMVKFQFFFLLLLLKEE